MMNKLLTVLITSIIACSVYSAEDIFKKPQSYVFLQNETQHENNNDNQVDFFELSRQQEKDQINQRDANVLRINENRANTSNMSPFERSQYLLKNNDTQALSAHTYEQQLKSIQQARNRGVISEQDYQQQILKQNNIPLQQKDQPLKFSIP
ncbi:hypothetical protein KTJ16_07750 [Acinetobacter bereziniae]|uniref:hypothetical protein n=1 Tax=Acinetobacter bereziniae TaxID=106648 RepID=UPI000EF6E953|nr:hypothetical protein [Acinetobacter bereziniae]MBJ8424125.1 hypothetical protein [Acinetobacter bereziniae]MCU4476607.1 hypothetical protein [Acinetobacter bereziniae]MCU4541067.1 hypothetical protein [Acinetobacter bereziniae]MCU4627321.1 hypothetical protein [Acinetobacter bereziniae]